MDKKEVEFRLLTLEDISMLEDIMLDDDGCYNSQQIEKFMKTSGNLAFGAIVDKKIVGLIYGYSLCQLSNDNPQFFVYSVAIHSNYQNKGYGSKFFQYVVNYCQQHNYAEVFVPTDKGNPRACRVYEKAGGKNDFEDEIIYVIKFAK